MLTSVWQWVLKSRRRQFGCVSTLLVLLLIGWFWNDFCLWRADVNLGFRNHHAAEIWFDRSRWSRNQTARTCLVRLRLARRLGRYQDVEQLLRQAQKVGVRHADIQREQWLVMAQTGQFDEVSLHWPELLSDPRDDEPEIARAFVVWASSRDLIDQASRVLDLWKRDYPDDPEPWALQGQIFLAMNHEEGAVESYRKALAFAPSNVHYRLALANVLQKRLQLDEAGKLFQECVQRMPDNVAAVRGLAATYTSQGELEKAVSILEGAIKRFPDNLELHQSLGEVYLAKGDDAAAVPHFERIHAAYPENADIAYLFAQALKAVQRESEAAALFEFVAESREPLSRLKPLEEKLAKRPNDLEVRFQIASICAKYKSREEAIRWLEKLLLVAPKYRPAHEALIELYRLTGEPPKSADHQKIVESLIKAGG